MRLRIHDSAHQIGGSCIPPESAGIRLLSDLGMLLEDDLLSAPHRTHQFRAASQTTDFL